MYYVVEKILWLLVALFIVGSFYLTYLTALDIIELVKSKVAIRRGKEKFRNIIQTIEEN